MSIDLKPFIDALEKIRRSVARPPTYLRSFLDISTAHVTRETARRYDDGEGPHMVASGEYGWLLHVPEPDGEADGLPGDIAAVFACARRNGCDMVLFDRDATVIDELPSYDW